MSSASDQLHQHLVLGPIHTRVRTIQKQYREVQGDDDVAEEFAHLSWLDCELMLERVPVDNAHVREIQNSVDRYQVLCEKAEERRQLQLTLQRSHIHSKRACWVLFYVVLVILIAVLDWKSHVMQRVGLDDVATTSFCIGVIVGLVIFACILWGEEDHRRKVKGSIQEQEGFNG